MNDIAAAGAFFGEFRLVLAMGAVILFCRAFPFLFFRGGDDKGPSRPSRKGPTALLDFVAETVPPVAMTILAFNALGGAFRDDIHDGFLVLAASVFTAIIHLWKRNALVSIIGGTALYMVLLRYGA